MLFSRFNRCDRTPVPRNGSAWQILFEPYLFFFCFVLHIQSQREQKCFMWQMDIRWLYLVGCFGWLDVSTIYFQVRENLKVHCTFVIPMKFHGKGTIEPQWRMYDVDFVTSLYYDSFRGCRSQKILNNAKIAYSDESSLGVTMNKVHSRTIFQVNFHVFRVVSLLFCHFFFFSNEWYNNVWILFVFAEVRFSKWRK